MSVFSKALVAAVVSCAVLAPSIASAQYYRDGAGRIRSHDPAEDPYNPNATPGAAVRALSAANQAAPGVTNELAPGNIATASGGPSGGVPGFSGGR